MKDNENFNFLTGMVLHHLKFSETIPEGYSATWVTGLLRTTMQWFLVSSKSPPQCKSISLLFKVKHPFQTIFSIYPFMALLLGVQPGFYGIVIDLSLEFVQSQICLGLFSFLNFRSVPRRLKKKKRPIFFIRNPSNFRGSPDVAIKAYFELICTQISLWTSELP